MSEPDFDSIKAYHEVVKRRVDAGWVAGTPSITIEDIIRDAEVLGIEVERNSSNPGMFIIQKDGTEKKAEFEDIFPDFVDKVNVAVEMLRSVLLVQSDEWLNEEDDMTIVKTACDLLHDFLSNLDKDLKTERQRLDFLEKAKSHLDNPEMLVHVTKKYIESH